MMNLQREENKWHSQHLQQVPVVIDHVPQVVPFVMGVEGCCQPGPRGARVGHAQRMVQTGTEGKSSQAT